MTKEKPPFPTKQQILDFLRDHPDAATKREIARAFHVSGDDRIPLKALLREMAAEGLFGAAGKPKARGRGESLPEVIVVEIRGLDENGEPVLVPAPWEEEEPPPRIILVDDDHKVPAAGIGDRILVRLARRARYYIARPIRLLPRTAARIVGVFERGGGAPGSKAVGWIRPADKKDRQTYEVGPLHTMDAETGELVVAEPLPGGKYGPRPAKIVERLGRFGEPRSVSLVAIASLGIPVEFPAPAIAEAEKAKPVGLGKRTDLRGVPLVTIDGSDARDFDDAVFAEPDESPENKGGWHLLVAIADVAYYVRPGSALDKSAFERGNSVYFPDRVVPMLPEQLSNDLCSLRPREDRACMAVHIWIDASGQKIAHRFVRGLMRSAARLTYEQVQAAQDGHPDDDTGPLVEPVIAPLYGAFRSLLAARDKRGTLDLDIPERLVKVDRETGTVLSISPRPRLDSHRLIEEFMILANVCAAETLEASKQPCMYRVHDEPSEEKLSGLKEFLATLGLSFAKGQVMQPRSFMQLLRKVHGTPHETMVNQVVLRSQAQAAYSPDNLGHFGLALRRYAHFTSPIRRYADLLVHRGLIKGLQLGSDGLPPDQDVARFAEIGEHISATERRAAQAERDATDRYVAAYMANHRDAEFAGTISGVTNFGLFVTLKETGADGLIHVRSLPQDYYIHDETGHRLVGERTGWEFRLGQPVDVAVREADIVTGGLTFELLTDRMPKPVRDARRLPKGAMRGKRPMRGKVPRPGSGGKARRKT